MQSYEEAVIAGVCTVESAMISMGVALHKIQYFLFSLTSNLILKTEILNGYVFAVSVPSEKNKMYQDSPSWAKGITKFT